MSQTLMISPSDLAALRVAGAEFLKRWKRRGGKTTRYTCPHCKQSVETIRPSPRDCGSKGYWDSLKTCIKCGVVAFVLTWPNGDCRALRSEEMTS